VSTIALHFVKEKGAGHSMELDGAIAKSDSDRDKGGRLKDEHPARRDNEPESRAET
jgi:hypothetical protein